MTRGCRSLVGLAATTMMMAVLAMQGRSAVNASVQGDHAEQGTALGQINVQQRDLLQKTITNNWVSYNGDYTGAVIASCRRWAGKRKPSGCAMGLSHSYCRRA